MNSKDEFSQSSKKNHPMSFRQQILFALGKSLEDTPTSSQPVPEDLIRELEEYLQDEEIRVNRI
jgi:hypothetical protein